MRIPIRTPGGFNVDRRVTGGAAFRPNYSYRRYFGRRVGQRVYGMPFSGGSQRPRGVPNARRNLFSVHSETRRKTRQTIEEVQDGTNYLLCNNTSKVSYLTYPAKSRSESSSTSHPPVYIKPTRSSNGNSHFTSQCRNTKKISLYILKLN